MALIYNQNRIGKVVYNGKPVNKLIYNGNVVFSNLFKITVNSYVKKHYPYGFDFKATIEPIPITEPMHIEVESWNWDLDKPAGILQYRGDLMSSGAEIKWFNKGADLSDPNWTLKKIDFTYYGITNSIEFPIRKGFELTSDYLLLDSKSIIFGS